MLSFSCPIQQILPCERGEKKMKFHSEYFKDFRMLPDGFLSLRSRSMKGERHRCPSPTARFSTKCNITSVVRCRRARRIILKQQKQVNEWKFLPIQWQNGYELCKSSPHFCFQLCLIKGLKLSPIYWEGPFYPSFTTLLVFLSLWEDNRCNMFFFFILAKQSQNVFHWGTFVRTNERNSAIHQTWQA